MPFAAAAASAAPAASATPTASAVAPPAAAASELPPPTLDDVAQLDPRRESLARFVARSVAPQVRNAALKKLFADPRFNVMDGLDTYIDDYTKPDPLPRSMLRQLAQGRSLGLFDDDEAKVAAAPSTTEPSPTPALAVQAPHDDAPAPAPPAAAAPLPDPHEDPDLQLQPDDAARCSGVEAHARGDAGRER